MTERSRLRQRLSRWTSAPETPDRDRRSEKSETGEVCIADAPDRRPCTVNGSLRTITLRPRGGVPALEAELDDGTAVLTVIWLGRRQIAGISPGCQLRVSGRIGILDGTRTMYNPRYELLP